MARSILLSALGASALLVACGPSHFVSPGVNSAQATTLMDPSPLVAQAHAAEAADPSRAFRLLAEACELGNAVDACIEAGTREPMRGLSLVAHGCALGSADACKLLSKSEITYEHKSEAAARADVDRVLEMGCLQGVAVACMTRNDLDIVLLATTTSGGAPQNHHAVESCVESCKARSEKCVRQCEAEGGDDCGPTSECAGEEHTCTVSCQANAAVTCAVELRGACQAS
jgi:hypothetical protein